MCLQIIAFNNVFIPKTIMKMGFAKLIMLFFLLD